MFRAYVFWIILLMGALPVSAQAEGTAACAACLSLTSAEWSCLKSRLDQYQQEPADPVLASVLGCNKSNAPAATLATRQDAPIGAKISPTGDRDAARKVFFLTKLQISCLKAAVDGLAMGGGEGLVPFDLSHCPAANAAPGR